MKQRIRRRVITEPVDKDEAMAQTVRAMLGGRRRAFTRAQADAPGYPARATVTQSGSWPTAEEIQAACDRATGNARWKASQTEHGEAMSMLLRAGARQDKVFALGATKRLTRRLAQDIIARLPNWPK